jgi:carbamoyltransferase
MIKHYLFLTRPNKREIREYFGDKGIMAPIEFVEHHISHAASAYYTSGWDSALIITSDGGGDGLSGSVLVGEGGRMKRIATTPKIHSLGCFWGDITYLCGFNPATHGGKITGLAAYKPSPEVYGRLRPYYGYSKKGLHFVNKTYLFWREHLKHLRRVLDGCSIEEISYAAQHVLEENMLGIVKEAVRRTGKRKIALAGGTFANVRLNQKILDLEEVEEVFIHPHMGDGGLAVGAALATTAKYNGLKPLTLDHVFFGPEYNERAIIQA